MSPTDQFLAFAHDLADLARSVIRPRFRSCDVIEVKGGEGSRLQVVTDADRMAEDCMREAIRRRFPNHGIVGEEHGSDNPDAEHTWILDPIDGTKAFVAGLPVFGTLIGLLEGGQPQVGIIDQAITGERLWGSRDGAWLNGELVQTRRPADRRRLVIAMTEPDMIRSPQGQAAFRQLADEALFVRYGTDCWGYGMLASGHIDVVVESDVRGWDVLPGAAIIHAAGGRISAWDGALPGSNGTAFATGDPQLHAELLERFPDSDGDIDPL